MLRSHLSLSEALSQAWFNQYAIVMTLVTIKIHLFSKLLISVLSVSKDASLTYCQSLVAISNMVAEVPAQYSALVGLLVGTMTQNMSQMTQKGFSLILTILSALIEFILELYLGTITCLCVAFVGGAIDLVVSIIRTVTEAVEAAINTVLSEFDNALLGLSLLINTVISGINALRYLLGNDENSSLTQAFDRVNLTVSSLKDISIPTGFLNSLEELSENVPDFEDVLSNITTILVSPITKLATLMGNISYVVPAAALAERTNVNEFEPICEQLEASFENSVKSVDSVSELIVLILSVLTGLLVVANALMTYWAKRRETALFTEIALERTPLNIGNILADHQLGIFRSLFQNVNPLLKWLMAYITARNPLKCLMLGLVGLGVVGLQEIIFHQAKKQSGEILTGTFDSLKVKEALAKSMSVFLNDTQKALDQLAVSINQSLLLSSSEKTLEMLLSLDGFQSMLNSTINSVFGNSSFASPLRTIVYCTIGRKIDAIREAMTWIVQNFTVKTPHIEQAKIINFSEIAIANITQRTEKLPMDMTTSLDSISKYQKNIFLVDLFSSVALVSVWVINLLIGLVIVIFRKYVHSAGEIESQEISWPSKLEGNEKDQYEFPYNDPFSSATGWR